MANGRHTTRLRKTFVVDCGISVMKINTGKLSRAQLRILFARLVAPSTLRLPKINDGNHHRKSERSSACTFCSQSAISSTISKPFGSRHSRIRIIIVR